MPAPVRKPTPPLKSWSFSRYQSYRQCPLKFKLTHLDKMPEPKGQALLNGAKVHEEAEGFLKGTVLKMPNSVTRFAAEMKRLRGIVKKTPGRIVVEDDWAFTRSWGDTTWNDWDGCWVRIKLDVFHFEAKDLAVITDFKTGKFRSESYAEYLEQLELYALGALLRYAPTTPGLRVRPRLLYLDHGITHPDTTVGSLEYTAADVAPLKKAWEARVKPMFNDKAFAPRPNQWCGWCHFRKSNGGPCKY